MQRLTRFQHIIFDFDGVLAETNSIRIEGFKLLFSSYPVEARDSMVSFASENGGLSRYVKIRHFFDNILSQTISDDKVQQLADRYSDIVKNKIIAADAVKGSTSFLSRWTNLLDFSIISGSDESELRSVCASRGISHFFNNIFGSPATKQENFQRLLDVTGWERQDCLFIGDTRNDLIAARDVGIAFLARDSGIELWQSNEVSIISDLSGLETKLLLI